MYTYKYLQSDHPDKLSIHLAPRIVIIIVLTIFPMLYILITIFRTGDLYFLIPFTHPLGGELLASHSENYSKMLPHRLWAMPLQHLGAGRHCWGSLCTSYCTSCHVLRGPCSSCSGCAGAPASLPRSPLDQVPGQGSVVMVEQGKAKGSISSVL